MLIKLAKTAFEAASWPTAVVTGRYMFPLGDNMRNVQPVSPRSGRYFKERTLTALSHLHPSSLRDQEGKSFPTLIPSATGATPTL